MRPLKIDIPGRFYDSFIYNGRLLLWDMNGALVCINWDDLLFEQFSQSKNEFAYTCAFLYGDYLYGDRWSLLFNDEEIKNLVKQRFSRLVDEDLTIDISKHNGFCEKYENPYPFPHSDCLIYRDRYSRQPNFYFSTSDGIFKSSYYKRKNGLFSKYKNVQRISDVPCFNLSANASTIAAACGEEGVFGCDTNHFGDAFSKISQKHASWINWTFSDVFSSSYYNNGYLIGTEIKDRHDTSKEPLKFTGEHDDIGKVFKINGLSWGVHDKICIVNNGILKIARYNRHWKEKNKDKFEYLADMEDARLDLDGLIRADSAPWGYILEYKTKLVVIKSNHEIETINYNNQEITNWRIFSRAIRYSNQLHVIFDDHISIYSFNDDYFENQWEKSIGTRYIATKYGKIL